VADALAFTQRFAAALLAALVDTMQDNIRRGEALREGQRGGAKSARVSFKAFMGCSSSARCGPSAAWPRLCKNTSAGGAGRPRKPG